MNSDKNYYDINDLNKDIIQYRKIIRKDIRFFVSTLLLSEIYFYGFTINYPEFIDNKNELINTFESTKDYLIDKLKEIDLIEFVYISEEIHGKRQKKREKNNTLKNNKIAMYLKQSNKTMEGLPHIHGIIGVRSIIKDNENLLLNITDYLKNCFDNFKDIDISELKTKKDIIQYWEYSIKENNFGKHRFINYSKFYDSTLYGMFSQKKLVFSVYNIPALKMGYIPGKHCNIRGLLKLKNNSNYYILYIIVLYFEFKNYKINNYNIYIKNDNFKYTWNFISSLDSFLRENITNIFNELQIYFPFQLINNNNVHLLLNDINIVLNLINTNIKILPIIQINHNIIEFTDGIYFLNSGYFYNFYNNKNYKEIICYSLKAYNQKYRELKKPKYWLSFITKNFKSKLETENFCANLGYYFNCDIEHSHHLGKKKSIAIVGQSNTGKTSLIANPLLENNDMNDIGFISDISDSFVFEDIEHKKLIICDEFKYIKNTRSTLLKLLDSDPILINKKYKNKFKFRNKVPIIFIFNEEQNAALLNDNAFKNRLIIYTFTQTIDNNIDLKHKIKKELSNILIYCNNMFFKKYIPKNSLLALKRKSRNHLLKDNISSKESSKELIIKNDI